VRRAASTWDQPHFRGPGRAFRRPRGQGCGERGPGSSRRVVRPTRITRHPKSWAATYRGPPRFAARSHPARRARASGCPPPSPCTSTTRR
jgi:hypothetical protein